MKRVGIEFGYDGADKDYEIYIGCDIADRVVQDFSGLDQAKLFIISDMNLMLEAKKLESALAKSNRQVTIIPLEAGEQAKELDNVKLLYDKLIENKADRGSVIFALGGGTTGDVAGFVASTFLRGVRWVGLPSTLLAQVDSSIGGKTGVNHKEAKNLIGSIYQPSLVICDVKLLKTLSNRDYLSGVGEVVKYAISLDMGLFSFLEERLDAVLGREEGVIAHVVERCVQLKADIVAADEYDKLGLREVLNFGHTVGHALERVSDYQNLHHGEAVMVGMKVAVEISRNKGHLSEDAYGRVREFLSNFALPPGLGNIDFDKLMTALKRDKKIRNEKINFVLLSEIGKTVSDDTVDKTEIFEAMKAVGINTL